VTRKNWKSEWQQDCASANRDNDATYNSVVTSGIVFAATHLMLPVEWVAPPNKWSCSDATYIREMWPAI